MAETPPELLSVAKRAAAKVEEMVIEMLIANELGEVAIVIGFNQLEPEKRKRDKRGAIKLERGRWTVIERVG